MQVLTRRPMTAGILVGALVVVLFSLITIVIARETDRQCPGGWSPATNPSIGSDCFRNDRPLPDGYQRDPGGNKVVNG